MAKRGATFGVLLRDQLWNGEGSMAELLLGEKTRECVPRQEWSQWGCELILLMRGKRPDRGMPLSILASDRRMVAVRMDELRKQTEQLKQERCTTG